jgi:hypothetical protein
MAGDRDGDRVDDSVDNCPDVMNFDQYDEDGDGAGDLCDLCPIVSSLNVPGADVDDDGDGIGAACDPNPNANADRLLLFEPFNGAPANTITQGTGSWAFTNSQAVTQVPQNEYASLLFGVDAVATRPYLVITGAALIGGGPQLGQDLVSGAGVIVSADAATGGGVGCSIGDANGVSGLYAVNIAPNADQAAGAAPLTLSAGNTYQVVGTRPEASLYACDGPGQTSIPSAPATTTALGLVGVHARSYSAAFSFIYVVDTAGTP